MRGEKYLIFGSIIKDNNSVLQTTTLMKLLIVFTCMLGSTIGCDLLFGQPATPGDIDHLRSYNSIPDQYKEVLRQESERSEPIQPSYASILLETIDYLTTSGMPEEALPLVCSLGKYYIFGDYVDHDMATTVLDKMDPYLSQLQVDSTLVSYYTLSGELNNYTNHPDSAIQDTTMYLWALSGQSTLYSINGLYHEANEKRMKTLETAHSSGQIQIVAVVHLSAALEYKDRRMDSLQYDHLLNARQYMNIESDVREYIKTITFAFQTQYFSNQNNPDSTDYFMNEFEDFYRPQKHGSWIENYYLISQASQAKVHHKFSKSVQIGQELIDDAKKNNKLTNLTRIYDFMVDVYNQSGIDPCQNQARSSKRLGNG